MALTYDPLDRPLAIGPTALGPQSLAPRSSATPDVAYQYRGPHLTAITTYGNGLTGSRTFDAARRPQELILRTADGDLAK